MQDVDSLKSVFIDRSQVANRKVPAFELPAKFHKCDSMMIADMVVVKDLSSMIPSVLQVHSGFNAKAGLTLQAAIICGKQIVVFEFFAASGTERFKFMLKYKGIAACKTKNVIYPTEKFQSREPALYDVLCRASCTPTCKVRVFNFTETFVFDKCKKDGLHCVGVDSAMNVTQLIIGHFGAVERTRCAKGTYVKNWSQLQQHFG